MGALKGSLDRAAGGLAGRTGETIANGGEPGSSTGGEECMRRLGPATGGSSCEEVVEEKAVPLAEATAEGGLKAPKALAGAEVTRLKGVLNELCVGTRCGPRPAAAGTERREALSEAHRAKATERRPGADALREMPIVGLAGGSMSPTEAVPASRDLLETVGPATRGDRL